MATVTPTLNATGHDVRVSATKILINNRWVDSVSGKTFPVVNPLNG